MEASSDSAPANVAADPPTTTSVISHRAITRLVCRAHAVASRYSLIAM